MEKGKSWLEKMLVFASFGLVCYVGGVCFSNPTKRAIGVDSDNYILWIDEGAINEAKTMAAACDNTGIFRAFNNQSVCEAVTAEAVRQDNATVKKNLQRLAKSKVHERLNRVMK